MTIFEISRIMAKIGLYQLFKIYNISYLEIRPSEFIDGVAIKVADMSNEDSSKWEFQERLFSYDELLKLKGSE